MTTRAGAIPEVLGDAAELVDVGDVDGLAGALARVLTDDGLRARLSQGALDHARTLTWSNTSTELMRVVAAEVARRRARR